MKYIIILALLLALLEICFFDKEINCAPLYMRM